MFIDLYSLQGNKSSYKNIFSLFGFLQFFSFIFENARSKSFSVFSFQFLFSFSFCTIYFSLHNLLIHLYFLANNFDLLSKQLRCFLALEISTFIGKFLKTLRKHRLRAVLSVLSLLFMLALFLLELTSFLTPDFATNMILDPNTDQRLRINFNITVLDMVIHITRI